MKTIRKQVNNVILGKWKEEIKNHIKLVSGCIGKVAVVSFKYCKYLMPM